MSELTIIVVDDDPIIARLIEMRLKKMGYKVPAITSDGNEAIGLAGEIKPDLIIMDIKISGDIDGIDTANQINENYSIPVVYLTGDTDVQTFQRAKLTEDCEYLVKPFSDNDLYIAVELTAYKHALNKKVRMQQAYFTRIFKNISEAVIAANQDGSIQFANPAAEALTLHSAEELLQANISEVITIIRGKDGKPIESPVDRLLRDDESAGIPDNALLITKDGKFTPVEGSISPLKDDDGKVNGIVMILSRKPRGHYLEFAR